MAMENKDKKHRIELIGHDNALYKVPPEGVTEFKQDRITGMDKKTFIEKWEQCCIKESMHSKLIEFDKLTDPLVKWLNDNHDTEMVISITKDGAKLLNVNPITCPDYGDLN